MKKIALFGGTFDPPHVGHVEVVVSVLERQLADEVWVILTAQNPLKSSLPKDIKVRREMVQATFSSIPRTRIIQEENVYTIDTIRALKKKDPEFAASELLFVIGSDAFSQRHAWKEWEAVKQAGVFLVVDRMGKLEEDASFDEGLRVQFLNIPRFDISSTEIRRRVRNGLYISHLVHPTVEKLLT